MKTKNYQWGPSQRKTLPQIFQWGIQREPRPLYSNSVSYLRYERMVWLDGRKSHRVTTGMVRAMGATNFFRGCYIGAEND
jgi:hypothetical protein